LNSDLTQAPGFMEGRRGRKEFEGKVDGISSPFPDND
jgi:hypothetical protein